MTTLHEALSISTVYKELIGGVQNPHAYLTGHPELFFKPILVALVSVPVQGFFAYRIFIFTKRNFVVPVLWFVAGVIQLGKINIHEGYEL
ncbi:hypothetical protein JVU11DRAFT_6646 [Chiua virens]|nr:hypothetical protein JVU11DRAFT_6646 [Chiua virens]